MLRQDKHLHVYWLARYPQELSNTFALQAVILFKGSQLIGIKIKQMLEMGLK